MLALNVPNSTEEISSLILDRCTISQMDCLVILAAICQNASKAWQKRAVAHRKTMRLNPCTGI
jgi:hypothetical protein